MEHIDFGAVSAQLAHPTGEEGIIVARRMNQSNRDMTKKAVDLLDCHPDQYVLEIGPGNGQFAGYVLSRAEGVRYAGTDISETMIEEGRRINQGLSASGRDVEFHKTDGLVLPYENGLFDRVFTVNTIYFWPEPARMIREIRRVLRPGGLFCVAFASRDFMENLPFTDGRFRLYDAPEVQSLLEENGLRPSETFSRVHETTSAGNSVLMREEIFIIAHLA